MSSTVWAFPQQPQLATAYFLALLTSSHVGFFYHFHYRTRPYAVFTSSCVAGAIEGMFMDPMLSFLHLLSVADLHSKVDIIVSHADWFNALHTKATGSVESLDQLDELCEPIEPSKSIGSTLDRIDSILSTGNRISSSHDRLGTLKSFTLWLTEVLPLFGKQITTNVRICINPSLRPTETSVDGTFIEQGLFMECRTRDKGRAIAFLCTMENFIGKCGARATDMQAVSLSVDLFALGEVCENIRFPQTDGLLFGGVAVRPQDVYSPGQKLSALAVSVNLWLDNIRSCLRTDQDIRGFRKAMKARGMQWVLQVGSQSASISLFHETKANTQTVDASSQDFCRIVRRHCSVERADSPVLFLKDSEKRVRTEEIRKLFTIIKRSLSHMLVVDFSAKKVGECIRIFSGDISAVPTAAVDGDRPVIPELLEWLKNNMPMYGVLPIYSVPDRTVTFTVDPKLLKSAVLVEQKPYRGGSRGDNSRKKK
uniref:Uncharacterized protein TCIL3000_11_7780 n=1 Tax=Trypanosoma congolense (strain IL3000) TaxID=1068625 RepID=G0V118_TRYCI|nr:unnamed protein product [Trypanosoma congolense IL3000]